MNAAPSLRHDALVYGSEGEFVAALEPFVRDGLEHGDRVVAVTTQANTRLLRDTLGGAASQVSFADAATRYRHPPQTVADYRRVLDEEGAAGRGRVRVIGEVQFGDTPRRQLGWLRYEAASNLVFASTPAWVVCPYDRRTLPSSVVAAAGRTHPHLVRGRRRTPSADYADPRAYLRQLAAVPPAPATPAAELTVDGDLAPARQVLRGLATAAGMPAEDVEQLTVAVNEALTNALLHGRPPVQLRILAPGPAVDCEITDSGGRFTDPLAGLAPPPGGQQSESGRGLWLMQHLCDHVDVLSAEGRTVLRLSKSLR